jgi:glycosyltransferase involved in cell wall biosynthesis
MRIAINAAGYDRNQDMLDVLQALAARRPGNPFIIFSDKPLVLQPAIKTEVIGPPITSLLGRRWWLDMKLPAALKKFRADVLVNINIDLSLRISIPQLIYIPGTSFLHYTGDTSSAGLLFLKFYLPKYLQKAKAVIAPSSYQEEELVDKFNIPREKISVIPVIADPAATHLSWEEKEQVKDGYADGREFFLFTGGFEPVNDVMTVLKAFSQFKKWQRSNMKLIITGNCSHAEIAKKINTFKFRDDVIVLKDATSDRVAKLLSSAYAVIHTPLYDASGVNAVAGMRSGTPVIASKAGAIPRVAGEAVLYADAGNEQLLAGQMIRLHKDEALRGKLIDAGKLQAAKYEDHSSADRLWQLITNTLPGKIA